MNDMIFNGFEYAFGKKRLLEKGESFENAVSKTVPNDDVNLSQVVKRMMRGEIVPIRELPFGDQSVTDSDPQELVDTINAGVETGAIAPHQEVSVDPSKDVEKSEDKSE